MLVRCAAADHGTLTHPSVSGRTAVLSNNLLALRRALAARSHQQTLEPPVPVNRADRENDSVSRNTQPEAAIAELEGAVSTLTLHFASTMPQRTRD